MRVSILGCGTSIGVPVIGCHCSVCASTETRNKRTRSSLVISNDGRNILIDTSTDFRTQALKCGIERIDAVFFTHPHADHIHGIDDLRVFNIMQKAAIPCFANAATIDKIKRHFEYIFEDNEYNGWKPELIVSAISSAMEFAGLKITPVEILHGKSSILGYRINDMAYLTDCSRIPPESVEKLKGLCLLIIGALREMPHPSHFSIGEAIEASRMLGAEKTILTHLSHNVDYLKERELLPEGFFFAYDGMEVEV